MGKTKLFIHDWKPESYYEPLLSFFDIEIEDELPESIDELSGIIMHGFGLFPDYCKFIEQLKKKNLPLFIQGNREFLKLTESAMGETSLLYDNVYFITTYEKLFSKVKEILEEQQ